MDESGDQFIEAEEIKHMIITTALEEKPENKIIT